MSLVTCPECGTKLRLKTELAPGKRLRCAKCSVIFAPQPEEEIIESIDPDPDPPVRVAAKKPAASRAAAAEPEEPEVWVDEEAEEGAEERPVRRKRRPLRPIRKKSRFGLILGLSLGGGFLLLAAIAGVVLFLVLGPSKNYREHDSIEKEGIKIQTEFAEVLESVKDPASAKAAVPKVERICDRLEDLIRREKALPDLNEKEKKSLEEKYQDEVRQLGGRLMQAAMNAGKLAVAEPSLIAVLKKYDEVIKTAKK